MILQNNMGHVIKGQMLQLTSELLSAKVMDTKNAPSDDIIFTLSPPVNNPKEGIALSALVAALLFGGKNNIFWCIFSNKY